MTTTTISKTSAALQIPTQSKIPTTFTRISMQQLFQIWQDLAHEATGHDTEWDYPIALERIAQKLRSTKYHLIQHLTQYHSPALELLSHNTALTFHYPV